MLDRSAIIAAVVDELGARAGACLPEHAEAGAAIADRLGLKPLSTFNGAQDPAPNLQLNADSDRKLKSAPRGRVYVFARQIDWMPLDVAERFGGVILATRSSHAPRPNRSASWCESVREAGVELVGWDWMLGPGEWRPGLASHVSWLAAVGARALCLNVEPAGAAAKHGPTDWRGKHDELDAYVSTARDLCDQRGLELWVSSWAIPPEDFPLLELLRPAHRAIPQPYEVHGPEGAAYVARVLQRWRDHGARDLIIGRGAHELDDDDPDHWRSRAQILAHRADTPAGMDEAWWLAGGTPPDDVVDAIVAQE